MSNTQNQTKEQKVAEIQRHVRQHKIIALGLVAGTVLTIWASKMEFGNHSINIAIAMVIACTQAFLIVGFFMNLISEKKMIYSVVVFAAVFFVVQMGITLWARSPDNVVQMR
jgi:caa(3)-type oxidase subunit IV